MRYPLLSLLVGLTLIAIRPPAMGASPSTQPARVVLLSGQNNHDWRETTPKIKACLEQSGQFLVAIEEHPELLTATKLQPFQVIVSNWNSFGSTHYASWPTAAKESYIDFVKRGGGHVVVHAGSSSFEKWEEYQKLSLATWKVGYTSHRRPRNFTVQIEDAQHPITQALSDFEYYGELWQRPAVQEGVTVLASAGAPLGDGGRGEPIAFCSDFGKGRSFTLLLGHDAIEMNNAGFVEFLVRGTHWAATGEGLELGLLSEPHSSRPLGKASDD